MRRLVAAAMFVLLTVLAGGDPLLCPDGCNDDAPQQAGVPAPSHADCLACRNALSTAVPAFDLAPDGIVEETPPTVVAGTLFLEPASIDHPPRIG